MADDTTAIADRTPAEASTQDSPDGEATKLLLRLTEGYYSEAHDAKQWRLSVNQTNREAFLGIQDWGDKFPGQSTEFLPKTGVAVEQFAAFFKRALTQAGDDWYELIVPQGSPLNGYQCRQLLNIFLDNMLLDDQRIGNFQTLLSDLARLGATESLCIAKVHGNMVPTTLWSQGRQKEGQVWRLRMDIIPFESFFQDPTGKNLYVIHEVERDVWEVQARAAEGLYDELEVGKLSETYALRQTGERDPQGVEQSPATPPNERKKATIRECWGTVLDEDGSALMHNAVWAIANGHFVIRQAKPNPFWHGESPFVCTPILRVPFSTHHRAIFDDAASLNLCMNELFNLLIDGGMASVWGTRQLRPQYLENPDQYADGIPQGETIVVNANCPPGEKALEVVAEGVAPPDAMAMFEALNREFNQAALTNDLRLGQMPSKSVKATEVVAADQATDALLDGIAGDLEKNLIAPLVRKAFLTVLQFLDHVPAEAIAGAIGPQGLDILSSMSPEERFSAFAAVGVRVKGLSAVLERARNFQKLMAILQAVTTNPILLQAFFTTYSPQALLAYMMKCMQIDPSDFERAMREDPIILQQQLAQLPMFQQLANAKGEGLQGTANMGGQGTGGNQLAAQVNQTINPMTGMTGNA